MRGRRGEQTREGREAWRQEARLGAAARPAGVNRESLKSLAFLWQMTTVTAAAFVCSVFSFFSPSRGWGWTWTTSFQKVFRSEAVSGPGHHRWKVPEAS